MEYARKVNGQWSEIIGSFRSGDLQYPANWPELATEAERAAIGVMAIAPADDPPADVSVLGRSIVGTDQPRWIWVTAPLSLDDIRAAKWSTARYLRDQIAESGCTTALGRVDTDPDSQRKITGAVTGALIAQAAGAPYSINWTLSDNSIVALDGQAMIALGVAVLAHIDACQAAGTAIRRAIEAADSAAAVAAVDIGAGYPEAGR